VKDSFETICAQSIGGQGENPPHILPIYQSSSFDFTSPEQGIEIFTSLYQKSGYVYSRYDNPTVDAVCQKLARLESYDLDEEAHAILCSSGMGAISVLCQSLLENGDHLAAHVDLYGGTTEYFKKILSKHNPIHFEDFRDLSRLESLLMENEHITTLYFETPTNPKLDCLDIELITQLGKQYDCKIIVDNTFCTPYIQRPLTYGVDYVIHSTTKYLNGHGTGIGGTIIGMDYEMFRGVIWSNLKLTGATASPFEAWLLNNGLKTLCVRLDRQCNNAMELAKHLLLEPKVTNTYYPGLDAHPDHLTAQKQMSHYGGMLTFEIDGGIEKAKKFMGALKLCKLTPTLGDVDTLILHPATSSHINMDEEDRLRLGITDGLIRISVGIENIADIRWDIEQALGRI
jgi:methionine-gamma-lyase